MNTENFIKIVEEEWKKGSFLPIFYGAIGYEEELTHWIPASVPTDWDYVIRVGIYELYRKYKDISIIDLCRKNIEEMLESDNPFSLWCGFMVCDFLLPKEYRGEAPFSIIDEKMIEKIKIMLDTKQSKLKKAKIWQGKDLKNGLWEVIENYAKVLEKDFGVNLLEKNSDNKPNINTQDSEAYLKDTVITDMETLLGRKLQEYVDNTWKEKQRLPRAVRVNGMDVPCVDADYGSFGDWKPEKARNAVSKEELEKDFGVKINDELYEYYRSWRFASVDWKIENLDISMDPIYENAEGKTSFFFTIMLDDNLYFKLGMACDRNSSIEYTLLFKNSGGVYLLEDEEDSRPIYLAENITALLNNVK